MALSVNVSTVSQLLKQIADVDQYALSMVGESIRIFDGRAGKPIDVSRYRRDKLSVGTRWSGPAIIADEETSTFVTENFDAWIEGLGSIVMERKGITA
jgi:N-methylhydantoinase A